MELILASASPRRAELLRQVHPRFRVVVSSVDEERLTTEDPFETAEQLALQKALAVFELNPNSLVLGGDTVVAYQGTGGWTQLAKPVSSQDARRMLRELSGRVHHVITGLALVWPGGMHSTFDQTEVTFRDLTDQEIEDYVATGESADKAGAYAIQGGAASFVDKTTGSISNVIGLPVEALTLVLHQLGLMSELE